MKTRANEYSSRIIDGIYSHRAKKNSRSNVWNIFHELIDDNGDVVDNFYFCTKCDSIEYSYRSGGNTTQLLRHPCITPSSVAVNINPKDIDNLKQATAKFVCLDLRPYNAVECIGLRELVMAGVEIGKKFPTIKSADFFSQFPSRYSTKGVIADMAIRAKSAISVVFEESIKQGGLGCTLDLWTDNFKSNSYMAMTANVFLLRDTHIEQKRLVFHMGLVEDIVKSKQVVKTRIINVFNDFGVNADGIKKHVTFTTDR